MGFKEDLARRIEKKRAEIVDLEAQVKTAKTYLQAFEDMYKLASRDASSPSVNAETEASIPSFRAGSMTRMAYNALKKAGRPLHVNDLLPAVGRSLSRADRSAISGTLASYVRSGNVFTRPGPNTFGLIEFGDTSQRNEPIREPVPPAGFGQMEISHGAPKIVVKSPTNRPVEDVPIPAVTDDDIPF